MTKPVQRGLKEIKPSCGNEQFGLLIKFYEFTFILRFLDEGMSSNCFEFSVVTNFPLLTHNSQMVDFANHFWLMLLLVVCYLETYIHLISLILRSNTPLNIIPILEFFNVIPFLMYNLSNLEQLWLQVQKYWELYMQQMAIIKNVLPF